ncbi:TIGR02453 family protein [Frankineae bacterium MT45]|nr:TIGR02453 family protein [Frankineae bacterium MT45]
MSPFTGIPIAALDFYEDLEDDNSKAYWTAHKQIYEESVRRPIEELVAALAPEFGPAKLFRPYRDVRFAKDKTPYKTHQGAWFSEASMYLEVSAAGLRVAGGYWQCASDQVERLRRGVADDVAGPQLERVLADLARAKLSVNGDQLTRVPAGYPKDHPRADLLRYKTLTAHRLYGAPAWLSTARAKSEVAKGWRSISPLCDWLQTHVGPSNDLSARR